MNTSETGRAPAGCPMSFVDKNIADPAVQRAPYAYYEWLRANDPVHWDEALRAFVVTKHELVRKAALDWATFSNVGTRDFGARSSATLEAAAIRAKTYKTQPLTVVLDPPRHTQYRKIMNQVLSQQRMRDSKPWVTELAVELVQKMLAKGGGDFVKEISIPLPSAVITRLLGLSDDMRGKMQEWADSYTQQFKGIITPERELECAHSYVEYHQFFESLIVERRQMSSPPNDLVSAVALSRLDDGSLLEMPEAISVVEQFVAAGAETTMNTLSMGGLALTKQPDLLRKLRDNDSAIDVFTEETLRLFAPTQGLFRIAQYDTELGGVQIPKGAKVMLRWGAANTDETVFQHAGNIDLNRTNAKQHVTFGFGIHSCQGATLARIELSALFRSLAEMLDGMQLDERYGKLEHITNSIIFMGLYQFPVSMIPRTHT